MYIIYYKLIGLILYYKWIDLYVYVYYKLIDWLIILIGLVGLIGDCNNPRTGNPGFKIFSPASMKIEMTYFDIFWTLLRFTDLDFGMSQLKTVEKCE